MRLDDYSKEMMDENSFIDMSYIYLQDVGKETNLYDIIDKFKETGGYSDAEIENRILQFYTDLNTDGRFLSTGDGIWGLRDWYSVDDISDKIAPTIHKFELAVEDEEPQLVGADAEIDTDINANVDDDDDDFSDAFNQDKDLVESDIENLDSPLNGNEVESEDDIEDAVDDDVDDVEYDDTDDLEDSYEDKSDL